MNRSLACSQQLTYDCRGASLLDQGEFITSGLEGLSFDDRSLTGSSQQLNYNIIRDVMRIFGLGAAKWGVV